MTQSQPSITPKPPLPTLSTTVLRLLSCAFTFHTVFDDREAHGKKDGITLPMSVYEDVWHASYDQGFDFAGNRAHLHRKITVVCLIFASHTLFPSPPCYQSWVRAIFSQSLSDKLCVGSSPRCCMLL